MLYRVYEVFHHGQEMPESWWRPRRVVGDIVFGIGGTSRYPHETANVYGDGFKPMLAEMEHAAVTPRKNGRMVISGEQRAADEPGLRWQKRVYRQEWLCIPIKEKPRQREPAG